MKNQGMRGALRAAQFAAAVLFVAACGNESSGPGKTLTGTVIPGASSGMPAAGASAAGADSQAPTDPGSVGNADEAMPMMPNDPPPAMTGDVAGQPSETGGSGGDGQGGSPSMASAGRGAGGSGGRPAPDAAVPDAGGSDDDVMPDAGAADAGWTEPDDDEEEERGL